MRVLITGGAGFIGSHLVDLYLKLNEEVIVVDNLSTGKIANIAHHMNNKRFQFYQAELPHWAQLEKIVSQSDKIYHLAAVVGMYNVLTHPINTLKTNIDATNQILDMAEKASTKPQVIIASSSEVYGSSPLPMSESDVLQIENSYKAHASYPVSKLCNEIAARAYYKEKNLSTIAIRFFNTVGPRQSSRYGMVLPRFIRQALNHEPLTVFSDGSQTRSFCDVRDSCKFLFQLSACPQAIGQVVNVGNDSSISVLQLAELVKKLSQSNSEIIFQSFAEAYGDNYINIQNRKPDLNKLKNYIDYQADWSLEETILDMIEREQKAKA